MFKDNFIHCDLHPGNILVQTNREPIGKISAWFWKFIDRKYLPTYPRLVILDCGLVVSLNDRCRQNLKNVFRSVLMGNVPTYISYFCPLFIPLPFFHSLVHLFISG